MATEFDKIIDMALLGIQDYKLDALYTASQTDFNAITTGFLLKGLPEFSSCKKPLTYSLENRTFDADLDNSEISILADLWIHEWFTWKINNVTQIENKMTPSDFKHFSEAENLKQKSEYQDKIREKYNQKIMDYDVNHIDWNHWSSGNYFN